MNMSHISDLMLQELQEVYGVSLDDTTTQKDALELTINFHQDFDKEQVDKLLSEYRFYGSTVHTVKMDKILGVLLTRESHVV